MTQSAPRGRTLETIRLGFMPLLDAAIPVIAARQGFASEEGIEIELVRETSWANVRDRLAIGHFDAAHVLGPMPIAAALGLTPHDMPLIAPMALGSGGNAITVSSALWAQMRSAHPGAVPNDAISMGAALKAAIAARMRTSEKSLVFGVVHPFSSHNYELRYWLAASGIDAEREVEIAILPPPYLPDALAAGRIDGFCVGEPWNTRAALAGTGAIIVTKQAIWPDSQEKMLALRADWAEQNAELVQRLIRAMIRSAQWCAEASNRTALQAVMADIAILGTSEAELEPALSGEMLLADGALHTVPGMLRFSGPSANQPWGDTALWIYTQMRRWGQISERPGDRERAAACFRADLYRKAAASLGLKTGDLTRANGADGTCFFDGGSTVP